MKRLALPMGTVLVITDRVERGGEQRFSRRTAAVYVGGEEVRTVTRAYLLGRWFELRGAAHLPGLAPGEEPEDHFLRGP